MQLVGHFHFHIVLRGNMRPAPLEVPLPAGLYEQGMAYKVATDCCRRILALATVDAREGRTVNVSWIPKSTRGPGRRVVRHSIHLLRTEHVVCMHIVGSVPTLVLICMSSATGMYQVVLRTYALYKHVHPVEQGRVFNCIRTWLDPRQVACSGGRVAVASFMTTGVTGLPLPREQLRVVVCGPTPPGGRWDSLSSVMLDLGFFRKRNNVVYAVLLSPGDGGTVFVATDHLLVAVDMRAKAAMWTFNPVDLFAGAAAGYMFDTYDTYSVRAERQDPSGAISHVAVTTEYGSGYANEEAVLDARSGDVVRGPFIPHGRVRNADFVPDRAGRLMGVGTVEVRTATGVDNQQSCVIVLDRWAWRKSWCWVTGARAR